MDTGDHVGRLTADGGPVRLGLLGEDLAAFRTTSKHKDWLDGYADFTKHVVRQAAEWGTR